MSLGHLSGISLADRNAHPKGHYCNYKMLTSTEEDMRKGGESTSNVKKKIRKGGRNFAQKTLKLVQQQEIKAKL